MAKKPTNLNELELAIKNEEHNTPLKAITLKCLDCSCYEQKEVKQCIVESCPLHAYRFGKNPFTKRKARAMTQEQKEQAAQRLREYHAKRRAEKNKDN